MKPTCNGLLCSRISGNPDLLLVITEPRSGEGRETSTSRRPIRRRAELHADWLEAAGMRMVFKVVVNSRKERIILQSSAGKISGKELPLRHTPGNPLRQCVQAGEKKKRRPI
jgi:hypothetical protein